jgi:Concanavalin A-like lectin/glucanases superfamily
MRSRALRLGMLVGTTAAALCGVPAVASAATTVSYWHMNETSGSTMVDSVNHLNGTAQNVTFGVPAVFSPGYSFNGSSSIVTVPSNGFHNVPANTTFTVTVYVRFPSIPSSSVGDFDLIRKGLSSTSGGHWKMEIYGNGKAYCQFRGSSSTITINNGPVLADNKWHGISCIKRTSSLSLVVDGTSYTKSGTIGGISNTARLTVGAKSTGGDWYKGIMDEVSISLG